MKGEGTSPSPRDKLQGVAIGQLIYYFGGFGPKSSGLEEEDEDEEVCILFNIFWNSFHELYDFSLSWTTISLVRLSFFWSKDELPEVLFDTFNKALPPLRKFTCITNFWLILTSLCITCANIILFISLDQWEDEENGDLPTDQDGADFGWFNDLYVFDTGCAI